MVGLLVVLCVGALGTPAGARSKPPKVALIYGDSLVWESTWAVAATASTKWAIDVHATAGTAPCDWLTELPNDLSATHPAVVAIAFSGNSYTPCMTDSQGVQLVVGSAAYFAAYQSALNLMFSEATTEGAQVVFVEDPPMPFPSNNAALTQIITIGTALAGQYRGVSVATSARRALSKGGGWVGYKPCLKDETPAMGCVGKQIPIRTQGGLAPGLHLCPTELPLPNPCPEYSSGEERFGTALAKLAMHPPKPVVASHAAVLTG